MGADLEWRIGDDLPEASSAPGPERPRAWRRWLIWALVLLLVLGAAYAWWRQRQRALDQAEAQVRQVARLELRALSQGDVELYMSLQDDADAAWREAQKAYVETAALPLPIQHLTTTQTLVEAARIVGERATVDLVHRATLPDGASASFRARRFYRYATGGRWLHTQAVPDVGGEPQVFAGPFVELKALEEDAPWLEPLSSDLQGVVGRFCDLAPCQQDLPVRLDLAAGLGEAAAGRDLILPAPYLLGTPENQAARDAWEAGLQAYVVDHLTAREVGREPDQVAGELLAQRLALWFRAQVGGDPWLATERDRRQAALDAVGRSEAWLSLSELYWVAADDPRRPLAAAQLDLLFEFLESEYGPSAVAELVRAFGDGDDIRDLLRAVVDRPWPEFEARYSTYLREETVDRRDDLDAFASYDLILSCEAPGGALMELWGLRLGDDGLTLLSSGLEVGDLWPVSWSPDGSWLLAVRERGDASEFYLLEEGSAAPRPLPAMPEGAEPLNSWSGLGESGWSPDGHHLAYTTLDRPARGGVFDVRSGEHALFDGNFIAWSPDANQLIYGQPVPWHWSPELEVQTFWTWHRESDEAQRLGHGYAATWSPDGARVAYVTAEPALRTVEVATGDTHTLLDGSALRRTLRFSPTLSPISGRPFVLDWSPTGAWIALGATRAGQDQLPETLALLVRDGATRALGTQEGGLLRFAWSPDGRWLTRYSFAQDQTHVVVSDIEGEILFEDQNVFVSWSPRGRHMAVFQTSVAELRMLEVESRQWQSFQRPRYCWPARWNPRANVDESAAGPPDLVPSPDWRSSIQQCDLPHCQP